MILNFVFPSFVSNAQCPECKPCKKDRNPEITNPIADWSDDPNDPHRLPNDPPQNLSINIPMRLASDLETIAETDPVADPMFGLGFDNEWLAKRRPKSLDQANKLIAASEFTVHNFYMKLTSDYTQQNKSFLRL